MKKKLLALVFALVSVFALCSFAACGETSPVETATSGNVSVTIAFTADSDVLAMDESTSVKDYLDALVKESELSYGGYEGDYGYFVESFYGLKAEGNTFWAFYTDLVTIEGDNAEYSNAEWGTVVYQGKSLYSAANGISGTPCVEGYTYAFVLTAY